MEYQVYVIKFKGEILYVGVTKLGINTRLKHHFARLGAETKGIPKLYEHMAKNNREDYSIEHVTWCKNKKIALRTEQFFIQKHNTIENGLNSPLPRGHGRPKGCSNPSGEDHYLFGKKLPEKVRQAVVLAQTGRKHSQETIEKRRRSNMKADRKDCKPVVRDDGVEYYGLAEAARKNNVTPNAIRIAMRKNQNSNGHKWKYKDE